MAYDNQTIIETGTGQPGACASEPLFATFIQFDGDDTYPAGGTEEFQAFFRLLVGQSRTVVGVAGQDCGDYVPVFVPAVAGVSPDKLKVYLRSTGAEATPGDLSATKFNVVVWSY